MRWLVCLAALMLAHVAFSLLWFLSTSGFGMEQQLGPLLIPGASYASSNAFFGWDVWERVLPSVLINPAIDRFGLVALLLAACAFLPPTRTGFTPVGAVVFAFVLELGLQAYWRGSQLLLRPDEFWVLAPVQWVNILVPVSIRILLTSAIARATAAAPPAAPEQAGGFALVNLDPIVRTYERLLVWRASYRSAAFFLTLAPWATAFILFLIAASNGASTTDLGPAAIVLLALIAAPLAVILPGVILLLIPRRLSAIVLIVAPIVPVAIALWLNYFGPNENGAFGRLSPHDVSVVAPLLLFPAAITYSLMFAAIARVDDIDFRMARGWMPPPTRGVAMVRHLFGAPAYVSGAAPASWGVTGKFLAAAFFLGPLQLLPITLFGLIPDLAGVLLQLAAVDAPVDEKLRALLVMLEINAPALVFAVILVVGLALAGFHFGRSGRRGITRSYSAAVEKDDRPPALYLRAFQMDGKRLPSRRRGLLPRLLTTAGASRTLDEIVMERVSPYAPVVAIGRPDEPTPPFGAARIYVKGNDWQSVVSSLAEAGKIVIICLDSTPGVRWEIAHLTSGPAAPRTLFLCNPAASVDERWAQLETAFPGSRQAVSAHKSRLVPAGAAIENGKPTLLLARESSAEVVSCAVARHLHVQGISRR